MRANEAAVGMIEDKQSTHLRLFHRNLCRLLLYHKKYFLYVLIISELVVILKSQCDFVDKIHKKIVNGLRRIAVKLQLHQL